MKKMLIAAMCMGLLTGCSWARNETDNLEKDTRQTFDSARRTVDEGMNDLRDKARDVYEDAKKDDYSKTGNEVSRKTSGLTEVPSYDNAMIGRPDGPYAAAN